MEIGSWQLAKKSEKLKVTSESSMVQRFKSSRSLKDLLAVGSWQLAKKSEKLKVTSESSMVQKFKGSGVQKTYWQLEIGSWQLAKKVKSDIRRFNGSKVQKQSSGFKRPGWQLAVGSWQKRKVKSDIRRFNGSKFKVKRPVGSLQLAKKSEKFRNSKFASGFKSQISANYY
ncbi:MAG: hypothetical protein IPH20_25735 [Bacteroidales bacterium]|nr:hypothetical protein [Bacteroidales bacterium]